VPDVDAYLKEVVSGIEPTPAQVQAASASHRRLRDLLDSGNIRDRILGSYLSGSYARDTAIRPIDDVDVVFLIDPSGWRVGWSSLPSPEAVLTTFANAIRYRYPVSSVYGQRRSVRLQLSHLDIDVVPAIQASQDGTVIKIPDADANDWILSSPERHKAKATAVNELRGRQFKPLVKLLKFWNSNLPEPARFKSFTIETMAVRIFEEVAFDGLTEGFLKFLDFCCSTGGSAKLWRWQGQFGMSFGFFGTSVPDAAGTASNTAAYVDGERRDKFVRRATVSLDRLMAASRARFTEGARAYVDEALRS
jgi:hypothetical protein